MDNRQEINNKQLIINYLTHSNIMKKFFFLAAIASVALAGCTKNEPVRVDNPTRIGFTPISQRTATKATYFGEQNATYTGDGTTYESFLAYAAFTENNTTVPSEVFFNALACSYNATDDYWAPATPQYWPKAGYLSFRAFSPSDWTGATGYAGTVTNNWATGITVTGFTAGTDKTKQVDILYSNVEAYKQRSMYAPETGVPYDDKAGDDDSQWVHNGVNITFNHAMSAVQFRVVTDQDYTAGTTKHEFTVKKIEILYANNAGAFYENRDGSASDKLNTFANVPGGVTTYITKNKSNENTATPYWVPTEGTEVNYTVYEETTGQAVKTIDTTAPATAQVDATTGDFGLYGDFTLPMPQNLDHGSGNHQVTVKVTYDYTFTNGTNPAHTTSGLTTEISLAGKTANKYNGAADTYTINRWLINHKYFYTLVFKLDPIIFDPKVDVWVNVEDINIDLPYQN